MLSEPQRQYIEEVLGVALGKLSAAEVEEAVPEVLVWTASLSAEQLALLQKILASAKITDFIHVQGEFPPERPRAKQVLMFSGQASRSEVGPSIHWHLPRIDEMIGSDASVQARKKITWALLQKFST